jgi:cytochrome c
VNGPAFQAVAERYRKNVDFAVATLYRKIIYGGSGNWGQRPMSAHPQIREEDAIEMARWILALGDPPKPVQSLPLTGTYVLNEPVGAYVLRADYRDRGATGGVPSLESGDFLVLRPARFEVENCDGRSTGVGNLKPFGNDTTVLNELKHNAWFVVKRVDLAGLQTLTLRLGTGDRSVTYCGGRLEVHANSPGGPLLGTLEISRENEPKGPMRFREVQVPLAAFSAGESVYADVYFVFKNEANQGQGVAAVDWVEF